MEMYDYDKLLLDSLKARLPSQINPVWFLMDVLSMGKEAAYRRLRGEVSLTFKEAILLSRKLGISLNEVANIDLGKRYHYSIYLIDFETPSTSDYQILEAYLENIRHGCNDPWSQLAVSTNIFPQQLYLRYRSIAQFALFKWIYLSGERQTKVYHEVKVEERMQQIFKESRDAHLQVRTTYYIFDRLLCRSLVHDLKYFRAIGLLRDEDVATIKRDTHKLLDYMEQIACTGKYDNGNEVHMYVSDIQFNKAYYNLKVGEYHISVIEACVLNSLASTEKICYEKMNNWIHSRRRISTLISGSGEPHRITFFNELRRQLDES